MQQYLKQLTFAQKLAIAAISIGIFGINAVIEHYQSQPTEQPVHVNKK
jgi:tetrahydromethanopterin S-methyltransferase subunit D